MSPAKLMAQENHYSDLPGDYPQFISDAAAISEAMRQLKPEMLGKLMDMSDALARENWQRWQDWKPREANDNTFPAICLYKGDAYRALQAHRFDATECSFAQNHLRILSGLYGILKPYDRIMPYRLMVGLSWSPQKGVKNLYSLWKNKVTEEVQQLTAKDRWIVNLASDEYWKMIDSERFQPRVLTIGFREIRSGKPTQVSTFVKYARGLMARYAITRQIQTIDALRDFEEDNYKFDQKLSSETEWIFSRKSK